MIWQVPGAFIKFWGCISRRHQKGRDIQYTITNQLNNSDILLISPKYHSIWWGLLEICSFKSQCHIDVSIESSMTVSWIGEQVMSLSQVGKHISLVNYVSWVKEHLSLRICVSGLGLEVNFSVHLQIFAGKIFSTSKLVRPPANSFPLLWRRGWF